MYSVKLNTNQKYSHMDLSCPTARLHGNYTATPKVNRSKLDALWRKRPVEMMNRVPSPK